MVAEAGVNHNGQFSLAKKQIKAAAAANADAVKFQNYTADGLVTKEAPIYWGKSVDIGTASQYETFTQFPPLAHKFYKDLIGFAKSLGVIFFSTPFEFGEADFLDKLGVPMFKIASADLTYHQFLHHVAKKGKPIFLSTGASTIGEIEEAVKVITSIGNRKLVLLHCILSYPTAPEDANIRMIPTLQRIFSDFPIGFSDHTFTDTAALGAVALGATVIEKHFTADKHLPNNPDHKLGMDIPMFQSMVARVRELETNLGRAERVIIPAERAARKYARRSLVSTVEIRKGTTIAPSMLTAKRPGTGIAPVFFDLVVGRIARRTIPTDTTLSWNMV